MNSRDDIIVKFEQIKPNTLSLDDQLEKIISMRQKESTSNEDFIKMVKRELDILEKHGGTFLWANNEEDKPEDMLDSAVHDKEAAGVVMQIRKKYGKDIKRS